MSVVVELANTLRFFFFVLLTWTQIFLIEPCAHLLDQLVDNMTR